MARNWTTIPRAGGRSTFIGVEPAVSFVIRSLVVDGLRAAPFELHPEHLGPLQSAGLNAELWRRWLAEIVSRFEALYDHFGDRAIVTMLPGRGTQPGRTLGLPRFDGHVC